MGLILQTTEAAGCPVKWDIIMFKDMATCLLDFTSFYLQPVGLFRTYPVK